MMLKNQKKPTPKSLRLNKQTLKNLTVVGVRTAAAGHSERCPSHGCGTISNRYGCK